MPTKRDEFSVIEDILNRSLDAAENAPLTTDQAALRMERTREAFLGARRPSPWDQKMRIEWGIGFLFGLAIGTIIAWELGYL